MSLADRLLDRTRRDPARFERRLAGDSGTTWAGSVGSLSELRGAEQHVSATTAAYRCVTTLAQNAASVPLPVLVNGEAREDHPVSILFERPNPLMSGRVFREGLFARCEWRGESFVYLDRGPTGTGPVQGMWPIFRPVSPIVSQEHTDTDPGVIAALGESGVEVLAGYQIRLKGGRRLGLLPSEVLWLRYPDPDDPWGALAPWKAAQHAASLDGKARAWQAAELDSGGRPAGVIYLGDLEEEAFRKASAAWRSIMSGPKSANRHLLVAGPQQAKVDRLGFTAAEVGYLETRKWSLEETCLAFGVPKDHLVGGSTFENQRVAKTSLWSERIVPSLEVLLGEADRQILPEPGEELSADLSGVEALQERADAMVERLAVLLEHDATTLDEARAEVGLEPLPGGQGNLTLSAYRAAVQGPGAPPAEQVARSLLAGRRAERLHVTARGMVRLTPPTTAPVVPVPVQRAAVRAGRKPDSAAAVVRAYERHETAGRRACGRLADAMEKAVLDRWKAATRKALPTAEGAVLPEHTIARVSGGRPIVALADGTEREVRVSVDDLLDPTFWTERSRDLLESFIAGVWDDGGSSLAGGIGLSFDRFDPLVLEQMRARLTILAGQVTDTTRRAIAEGVLEPGVAEGKSIPDLADDLRAVFTDLRTWRAETIARTETVSGYNASSRIVALNSGGIVTGRTWLAASDSRVRDSHVDMDGEEVRDLTSPYSNGLMHPGDPSGKPAETINCRCVETYLLDEDA